MCYDFRRPCDAKTHNNSGSAVDDEERKAELYRTASRMEKPKAWEDRRDGSQDSDSKLVDNVTLYTYEDCAFVIDRISFVFFLSFNCIISLVVFITIEVGGRAQV